MRSNTKALAVIFAVLFVIITLLMMVIGGIFLSFLPKAVVLAYAGTSAISCSTMPQEVARLLMRDSGEYEKQA